MEVEVGRSPTLADIERILSRLVRNLDESAHVRLARDTGSRLFVESRLVSLFATGAQAPKLHVVDGAPATVAGAEERFTSTLSGLSAVSYASELRGADGRILAIAKANVESALEDRDGRAEGADDLRQHTYGGFDRRGLERPPLTLAVLRRESFRDRAVKILESVATSGTQIEAPKEFALARMSEIAFELYQNTSKHGCRGADGSVRDGFRYLQIRRHIATTQKQLLHAAEGFGELSEFLTRPRPVGSALMYEIAVGDQGMGIVGRLSNSRPDLGLAIASAEERAAVVNRIVKEGLSSDGGNAGAGKGIRNVLDVAEDLNGFVSVRTNDLWLFFSARERGARTGPPQLQPVSGGPFAPVVGTAINVLIEPRI